MEIKEKKFQLAGMYGYNIEDANISLSLDSVTGSYSVMILGVHERGEFEYVTKEEMELLLKLFKINS